MTVSIGFDDGKNRVTRCQAANQRKIANEGGGIDMGAGFHVFSSE
jgi:hypothetical protein